jgi:hypothetical protein
MYQALLYSNNTAADAFQMVTSFESDFAVESWVRFDPVTKSSNVTTSVIGLYPLLYLQFVCVPCGLSFLTTMPSDRRAGVLL